MTVKPAKIEHPSRGDETGPAAAATNPTATPETNRELTELSVHGVSAEPRLSALYETFRSDQETLGKIVSPTDPVHRALAERLNETVSALGSDPRDFTLHVLREPTINAFVFPGVIPASIFITTGLLGALVD